MDKDMPYVLITTVGHSKKEKERKKGECKSRVDEENRNVE